MKKILIIALIVIAGMFLSGNSNFPVGRINLYVERLDRAIGNGRAKEACGVIDSNARFTLRDTRSINRELKGGHDEMCTYFMELEHFYTTNPVADWSSNVDMEISRDFLRWRTVHVKFVQPHELEVYPERKRIKYIARKKMTLVKSGDTFLIKNYEINLSNE